MIKILILAILITASFNVNANDKEKCQSVATYARQVMTERQKGTSIIDITSDNNFEFMIVETAFYMPVISDEALKEQYITDFEAKFYISCLKH